MTDAAKPFIRRLGAGKPVAVSMLALALGACSSTPEVFSGDGWFSKPLTFATNPSPNTTARHQISDHRPLSAEEFVDAEGRCAGSAAASEAMAATSGNTPPAGAAAGAPPPTGVGVALEMSECEVVRRVGQPDRVEIGANEHSERSVVITYLRGPRPGVYRFVAGRLTVIEKAPEPGPQRPPRRAARG